MLRTYLHLNKRPFKQSLKDLDKFVNRYQFLNGGGLTVLQGFATMILVVLPDLRQFGGKEISNGIDQFIGKR